MNEEDMMTTMADEVAIMPEDEATVLDPLDQYLLKLIDQLESEA